MHKKNQMKLKIINKNRFVTSVSFILIFTCVISVMLTNQIKAKGQYLNSYTFINIVEGDTLWDIAEEYNHNNEDIRRVVENIMDENNMDTAMIFKGQMLKVPAK